MPNPGSGYAVAFAEDEGLRPVDGYFLKAPVLFGLFYVHGTNIG